MKQMVRIHRTVEPFVPAGAVAGAGGVRAAGLVRSVPVGKIVTVP